MKLLVLLALLAACERADDAKRDDPDGAGLPPVCRQYLKTLDRYTACPGLPAEARRSIAGVVAKTKANWATIPKDAAMPPAVARACRDGDAAIRQAMVAFRCP